MRRVPSAGDPLPVSQQGKGQSSERERCMRGAAGLPQHIGIIMDGNGRWAQLHGMPRVAGHQAGVKVARRIVGACGELGISVLTLYAFSTENWSRPREEVDSLMSLCRDYVVHELPDLMRHGVRLQVMGHRQSLPSTLTRALDEAVAATRENMRLILNLALNYGGRAEILDATRKVLNAHARGELDAAKLDDASFASYLYTDGMPDPDLIIRSAGEYRTSNFMVWQAAHALFWVTPIHWPDFREEHLSQAIAAWRASHQAESEE